MPRPSTGTRGWLGLALMALLAGCGGADTGQSSRDTAPADSVQAAAEGDTGSSSLSTPASGTVSSPESLEALKEEELTTATDLLRRFPEDAETLGLLAMVHRGQGHAAKATQYWERCLALNPNLADVHDGMGRVASRQGNTEEAITHWQRALALRPDLPGLRERLSRALIDVGRGGEAIELLAEATAQADDRAALRVLTGEAYMQDKQFDRAARAFEDALKLRPDASAHYGLGMVAAKSGDTDAARHHMAEFQRLKAAGRESQVDYVETRDETAEVRERAARVHEMAGRILSAKDDLEEAIVHWRRSAELDQQSWRPRWELGRAYAALAEAESGADARMAHLSSAGDWAETAWRLRPTAPEACAELGRVFATAGRYDDAASAYRLAVQQRPGRAEWARAFARVTLETKGSASEARTRLLKSLEQEPDAEGYHLLARTFARTGDTAAALAAAKRAVEMKPDQPEYAQFYETLQHTP